MPRSPIERVREKIRLRQYDMTVHAMQEMAEDNLDIADIEHAVLNGRVKRIEKCDPRGKNMSSRNWLRMVDPGGSSGPLYE